MSKVIKKVNSVPRVTGWTHQVEIFTELVAMFGLLLSLELNKDNAVVTVKNGNGVIRLTLNRLNYHHKQAVKGGQIKFLAQVAQLLAEQLNALGVDAVANGDRIDLYHHQKLYWGNKEWVIATAEEYVAGN